MNGVTGLGHMVVYLTVMIVHLGHFNGGFVRLIETLGKVVASTHRATSLVTEIVAIK